MGTPFEDSVFDFDLNFLQHSTNSVNDSRIDKQRKAISLAKQKTIATNKLIQKYYAQKEQFEQNEVILLAAKEECKQVCLDYKVSLEKCAELEKHVQSLENKSQEMEKEFELTKNQLEAMRSHAHQLQMLTKDHETSIESLKIESQLDKNNVKEFENKLLALKQENETLINDLCLARDIAMGKKKWNKHHKKLLSKYDSTKYKKKDDESLSESSSEETEFLDSSPASPLYNSLEVTSRHNNEATIKSNSNEISVKKDLIRITEDSDNSNEVVSEDTGRGSSLAFSEGDKCFNSPDYFSNDSPFTSDCDKIKEKRIFIDACTSPTTVCEIVNTATSPLMFDDVALHSNNNLETSMETDPSSKEYFITDIPLSSEIVTIIEKKKMIDVGTSTTEYIHKMNVSTSPLPFEKVNCKQVTNTATSPIPETQNCAIDTTQATKEVKEITSNEVENDSVEKLLSPIEKRQISIQNLTSQCEIEISDKSHDERICLESNNSNNVSNESSCDDEIETILSRMRLTKRLISPLPKTPVKLSKDMHRQIQSPLKQISHLPKEHTVCSDAMRLREENVVLQTSVAELIKEVQNIKYMLKKHQILPESPKKQNCVQDQDSRISMLFGDSDEEIITIDNDHCNSVKENLPLNDSRNNELSESQEEETVENDKLQDMVIENDEGLPNYSPIRIDVLLPDEVEVQQSSEVDTLIKNKSVLESNITIQTNDSISRIESRKTIEENLRIEDETEAEIFNSKDHGKEILSVQNKRKKFKPSKLSKFRNKLKPKSKIKRIQVPIRKLRSKNKLKPVTNGHTTSAESILKNKSAYEKACRVMREENLKKKINVTGGSNVKEVNHIVAENDKPQENESNNKSNPIVISKVQSSPKTGSAALFNNKSPIDKSVISQKLNKQIDVGEGSKAKEANDIATDNVKPQENETTSKGNSKVVSKKELSPKITNIFELKQPIVYLSQMNFDEYILKERERKKSINASPKKYDENVANKDTTPVKNVSTSKNLKKDLMGLRSPNTSPRKSKENVTHKNTSPVKNFNTSKNLKKDLLGVKSPNTSPKKSEENITHKNTSPVKNFSTSKNLKKDLQGLKSPNTSPKKSEESVAHKNTSPVKNSSTSKNLKKDLQGPKSPNTSPKKSEEIESEDDEPLAKNIIITRNRSRKTQDPIAHIDSTKDIVSVSESDKSLGRRTRLKRVASDSSQVEVECKRILRSHHVRELFKDHEQYNKETNNNLNTEQYKMVINQQVEEVNQNHNIFNTKINTSSGNTVSKFVPNVEQTNIETSVFSDPKYSILCKMLEKYGKTKVKFVAKKLPEDASNTICKKLENDIAKIIELPIGEKANSAMNKLVEDIQHSWNLKYFLTGFMKYLKDPARKRELFNKQSTPPAPPMTKSEQVLLFIIRQLQMSLPNTVDTILTQIEFSLFQLNRTPEFDVIESLSHFYAVLCRYFGFKNRLRLFLLDAMYCLQFKVVPLIKQCLDVWMHILPLAHMGIAKSPLVTCLVYLLHFYKCEDRFNRIQDIRFTLNRKYFYQITDWNETKILEMFRNSIKDLRDIKIERKMLRMAFIILAKRQGPKWCQKNIIKNMLLPMIEKEEVPPRIKQFCIELLGPLLKPYPIDMKVHCEIVVNQLLDLLNPSTPDSMKEAIFTSLIYMNKHNQNRVTQSLLSWAPKRVSKDFEELMRDFIHEKPFKVWKIILSRTHL